jgi:hypothetical protein
MTLHGLEGGGQSFIDLLKSCMLEGMSSSPSAPIILPGFEVELHAVRHIS